MSDLGPVAAPADGWHELPRTSASGAIDYVRTPWQVKFGNQSLTTDDAGHPA